MQAAKCGITRPAKVQHLADGGFVKAIKSVVDKLTTQTPKDAPLGSGAANQAKEALTTRKQVLDDTETKAVGMAKGGAVRHDMAKGGTIPGKSPTPTADNIKVDATAGEFMLKKSAADVLGPKVLRALNAVGDATGTAPATGKSHGAVRKMAKGGYPDEERKFARPTRAPDMLAAQSNPVNQAMVANGRAPVVSAPVTPNYTTTPGAAPASNAIKYVMPPDPINATTSPGATPAQATAAQPRTVPAARVAPQSAVKFSGDPMYPNSSGPAPARPAPAAPAAGAVPRGAIPAQPASLPFRAGQAAAKIGQTAKQMGPQVITGGLGALLAGTTTDVGNPAYEPNGNAPVNPLVAQIPTGGVPGAGPTPKTEPYNFYTDTETGRNIGNLASAASMIPGVGLLGKMTAPVATALSAVGGFGAQVRADRGAPADPATAPAVAAPAAAAPAAAAPYPETAANRTLAPPASPQAVATAVANPMNPAGAVTRIGNSYSGAPGVSGDISVNGKAPRGGIVQGTGDGTFTYGGSGSGLGGGVSDQALQEARLGAIRAGDVDGVKASYAAQGQSFGPKVDPIDALLNNGRPMTTRKAAALGALQKAKADQQAVEEQRKLERDKFGLDKITSELGAKTMARLNAAEEAVLSAKTPEARDMAVKNLEALQKRSQRDLPPEEYAAIAGGTDAMGNRTDPLIYSKRTGQRADQGTTRKPPAVGAVTNGYRFKGGDPADQKNWEKV